MNLTQFEQIFGPGEGGFEGWDTDQNGIVDSLELFAGLILFADARTEDKIRFLFDLFDFNEVQSISRTDLEFLLHCALSAALKLHGIADSVGDLEINQLIMRNFPAQLRISHRELLSFCSNSEDVTEFFQTFRIKAMSLPKSRKTYQIQPTQGPQSFDFTKQMKQLEISLGGKLNEHIQTWLSALLPPLKAQDDSKELKRNSITLDWIHGIRTSDVKHAVQYMPDRGFILYFVACAVIVYNQVSSVQRHYLEHTQEVVSLAVGNEDIACSGEKGQHPSIHVWKVSTQETLEMLSGVHIEAVRFLAFSHNDQQIISGSDHTLVIYEWKTRSVLITTHHPSTIIDMTALPRLESTNTCVFLAVSETEFTTYSLTENELNMSTLSLESSLTKSPITCARGQVLQQLDPRQARTHVILTGHADGGVLVWAHNEFQSLLANYEGYITAIEPFKDNFAIANNIGHIYIVSAR